MRTEGFYESFCHFLKFAFHYTLIRAMINRNRAIPISYEVFECRRSTSVPVEIGSIVFLIFQQENKENGFESRFIQFK